MRKIFVSLFEGLPLDEAIARMAVVVDAMLLLQFLNVVELSPGVRAGNPIAQRFVGMQQDLLEAAAQAHALILGQVVEQRGEAFFQAHRDVDPLDLERRAADQ